MGYCLFGFLIKRKLSSVPVVIQYSEGFSLARYPQVNIITVAIILMVLVLDLCKPFPLAVKNLFIVTIITCRKMKKIEAFMISPSYTKLLGIIIYLEGP